MGVFALAVAAAARVTGRLPRWVSYTGGFVGVLYIATIPLAGKGALNMATMAGFVWLVALGVAALREPRRAHATTAAQPLATAV